MLKRSLIFFLLMILFPAWAFAEGGLPLNLVVYGKPVYIVEKEMPIQVKLINESVKIIQVNKRFLLNDRKFFYELALEIKDPDGNIVPLEAKPQFVLPGPDDYVNLKPGQSATLRINLGDYFIIVEPGEYKIKAYYRNFLSPPPGAAWVGTIDSEEKTFSVVESKNPGEEEH
ncbi:MAG: hypothetical protein M1269_06920 [Chloroflexi bacterium]|nr:hypothetical protein [Chloroflexota bacterium]